MNREGFIQLPPGGAARGAQPAGGGGPRRGSVPPPPPPPPGGGGRGLPPQGVQRTVMPNQGQPINPQVIPVPQRNQIPLRYQQRPPVEICDIRRERMSETDIRDVLSDFYVIRFEKIVDEEEDRRYRDYRDGRHDRHKPKGDWKTVVRTHVQESKEDIIRQVRRLDHSKKGKTALEKKKDLNLDQQRQIEKAQEDLAACEGDPRYHIVLAQLDQTLKPVDRHDRRHYSRHASHHHRRGSHGHLLLRSKSRDAMERGRSKDRKRIMQRVSITAYYKRCPRPEQNPMLLLREREQMMNTPPPNQQQYLHQQHMQQQHQYQQQMQQQQRQQQQQQQQQRGGQQPPPPPGRPMGGGGPGRMGQPQRPRARSPSSSSDSSWSSSEEGFWSAGEEGSKTSHTESTSPSRGGRGRNRHDKRYLEHQPAHFGVRSGVPIRQHSRVEGLALPFAPVPPRAPALIEAEIQAAKAEAFAAGRHEGRYEGRQEEKLENRLANEEAAAITAASTPYRPRLAPPPRVIQPDRRGSVRLVDPRDLGYEPEESLDGFARLNISGRRRESARFDDRDSSLLYQRENDLLDREERGRMRERDAQNYMYRRESSPGSLFANPNPFAPRPRRNTVSYETRGRYYY